MATFETTRSAPFGAETVYRIASIFDETRATLVDWNNRRMTRNIVARLSERELADIGLCRADVENMRISGGHR